MAQVSAPRASALANAAAAAADVGDPFAAVELATGAEWSVGADDGDGDGDDGGVDWSVVAC